MFQAFAKHADFSSVQSLSHVRFFVTSWTAARQASLSITNSWSLLKLTSIESVMPSNHLILYHPLLFLPSIFPKIRSFQMSYFFESDAKGLMLLNCGAGEDSRVPWTARRSIWSILKETSPEYSLEGLMLKLKLQCFGHLMGRMDSLEKTLMLGEIEGGRRRGNRG